MVGRTSGPFAFRFLVQPAMAMLYEIRDGMKDAHERRPAYFWSVLTRQRDRQRSCTSDGRLFRVIGLGVVIDLIYQMIVFRPVYRLELIVIVLLLALCRIW